MNDKIAAQIQAEQDHGRLKWGQGPDDYAHDDEIPDEDWHAFIADHNQRGLISTPMERRQHLVKVAGLAISAIEAFDRTGGVTPFINDPYCHQCGAVWVQCSCPGGHPYLGKFVSAKLLGQSDCRQGAVVSTAPLRIRGVTGEEYDCEGQPELITKQPETCIGCGLPLGRMCGRCEGNLSAIFTILKENGLPLNAK